MKSGKSADPTSSAGPEHTEPDTVIVHLCQSGLKCVLCQKRSTFRELGLRVHAQIEVFVVIVINMVCTPPPGEQLPRRSRGRRAEQPP